MSMKKLLDTCETGINVLGVALATSDLENILNLVLLIISIAAILFRGGYAIYQKIKDKKYSEIAKELEDTHKALEDLKAKEDTKNG